MQYLVYFIFIVINIYFCFFFKFKNIKRDVKYFELKINSDRRKLINYLNSANSVLILVNIIYFILFLILKINISVLDIIFFIIHIISFVLFLSSKNGNKFRKSDKKVINDDSKILYFLISLISYSLIILQRVGELSETYYSFIMYLIAAILILTSFGVVVRVLIKNKRVVGFKYKIEDDYLKDVKFIKKLLLKNLTNIFLIMMIFILLIYINLPFAWLGYIFIEVMLLSFLINKIKKFKYQSDKLTKTVYILKENPGVVYAFEFYRDILLAKKIMLAMILSGLSILVFYFSTTIVFTMITIELFILFMYAYIIDKINLIKYISSLNLEFMNKDIYTLEKSFPISCIDKINVFGIDLYKIIYIDLNDNIYESNYLLYDPEDFINEINSYINPYKPNEDYIVVIKELYE